MFDSWRSKSVPKTAVCLHISYPAFAVEILKKLEAISAPFTLIVSHSGAFPEALSEKLDEIAKNRAVEIYQEPKIGFDILPFLYLLPRLMKFDVVCKLHTVRNFSEAGGRRNPHVETLIGSDAAFRKIVGYFARQSRIGMLGLADDYMSSYSLSENDERDVHTLLAEFAPNEIGSKWGFFAGTMFWARTEMLLPIADLAVDMEAACRYEDREIAHAVEPIFGLLPVMQNRKVAILDLTAKGLIMRKLDDTDEPRRNFIGSCRLEIYKQRQSSRVRTAVEPMHPSPMTSTSTNRAAVSLASGWSTLMRRSAAIMAAAENTREAQRLPVDRLAGKSRTQRKESR